MLSKCHSVAGEFIKISRFHQLLQESISRTRVKWNVLVILYFLNIFAVMNGAACKYQDI